MSVMEEAYNKYYDLVLENMKLKEDLIKAKSKIAKLELDVEYERQIKQCVVRSSRDKNNYEFSVRI